MPPTVIDLTLADSPVTKEPTVNPLLQKEIATVKDYTLRDLLQSICGACPEAARLATDRLLVSESEVRYLSAEESTEEEEEEEEVDDEEEENEGKGLTEEGNTIGRNQTPVSSQPKDQSTISNKTNGEKKSNATNPSKRLRGRFAICENCNQEFDVSDNCTGYCQWHEGELELNDGSETWWDWDEDCHGEWDTEENRIEFPEGFLWSCCQAVGDAEGCKEGRHVEPDLPAKRRRLLRS